RQLPKIPLLFPPAGWIMFYAVDRGYGFAEVYGIRNRQMERLDPHRIFTTRSLGYDNIRRNIMIGVLSQGRAEAFCRYLRRKLPEYDVFAVVYAQYDDMVADPDQVQRRLVYECK
ncbi:MAG: hypothetical protein Q8R78_05240, partial [Candidatus Omnitrophota bacterium]|nr:hypothetical protein [Candidatus Omnitrophota bacterium]